MSKLEEVKDKIVDFLNISNPLVDQATENTDTPIPFTLYNDICQLSFKDSLTCERLLEHLFAKVKKKIYLL